jgi:hypothetical protein
MIRGNELGNKEKIHAASVVATRLLQMRQLWEDAAENYFEPFRFLLALQNCITVSRTVTFIIQSNKKDIPDFDKWYGAHQQKMADDPILVWAKNARNSIEKQGDLKALSQVRGEIIASYYEGPVSEWIPEALFSSPQQFLNAVPNELRSIPHIIENGTLLIERRWVDELLPDTEVLEALAHVYSHLADLVVDLHEHLGVKVPSEVSETRPDIMGALAMDRAMYLSMSDGSPAGFRVFRKETKIAEKKLRKRYGNQASKLRNISEATTFRELVEAYFRLARVLMINDGYHHCFTYFTKDTKVIDVIGTDHPDRASRYVLMRDLAKLAHIRKADGMFMINEAWTAKEEDSPNGFAADAKNRGEALILMATSAACETISLVATVIRKKKNPRKVKRLTETITHENEVIWALYPFQRLWGCVDTQKMLSAEKKLTDKGVIRDIYAGITGRVPRNKAIAEIAATHQPASPISSPKPTAPPGETPENTEENAD